MDSTNDGEVKTQMVSEVASFEVDEHTAVEVHLDQFGNHWVGRTIIRNPRDWEFFPREQFGKGESGRRMAESAASGWAAGLRYDATAR